MKALAFALSLCATAMLADVPPGKWPTQEEAQREFESCLAEADAARFFKLQDERIVGEPILVLNGKDEIRTIPGYFRFVIPDDFEIVDGKKRRVYRSTGVGGYAQFRMVLVAGDRQLLEVDLVFGKYVCCSAIKTSGVIEVDKAAHLPLFERLVGLLPEDDPHRRVWEKMRANQALQTTPMTRSVYEKTIELGRPQRGV